MENVASRTADYLLATDANPAAEPEANPAAALPLAADEREATNKGRAKKATTPTKNKSQSISTKTK